MQVIKKYPVISYFVLTFLITWIIWAPSLLGYVTSMFLILPGGFGPMIAAVIVTWVRSGKQGVLSWLKEIFRVKFSFKEYLLAFLTPIGIGLLGFGIYFLLDETPSTEIPSQLWQYPIFLLVIMLIGGGQEEPGWRGFALPHLMNKYSPLISSIIIGVVWSLWHVPPFLTEGTAQYGIPFGWYLLNTTAISVILTKIYLRTKSVVPAMIVHAGLNALGNYAPKSISTVYPYVAIPTILIAVIIGIGMCRKKSDL